MWMIIPNLWAFQSGITGWICDRSSQRQRATRGSKIDSHSERILIETRCTILHQKIVDGLSRVNVPETLI